MAINKVVYGNNTLIDLTNDTVEASNLLEGETAHDRSGTPVTGTAKQGHTIKDGDGTAMPTQPNLQFVDAKVTNDGTGGATVVKNFVDIDWDDWQEVDDNDDTYYRVTDAPLVDGNVEVDLMKKLWENPAPTASFSAQNITLASDDYDFILWIYHFNSALAYEGSTIAKKGENAFMSFGDRGYTYFRAITAVSDTVYTINNATNDGTTDNTYIIPVAIYGIKQKFTISLSAIISNVSTSASKCMLSDGETSVEDKFNEAGDYTLLSEVSASGTVTVGDMSAYKYIMCAVKSGTLLVNPIAIPYKMFKAGMRPQSESYISNQRNYCCITYVSDTSVTFAIGVLSNFMGVLYGIK